jgi:RHS repeat-associated protein
LGNVRQIIDTSGNVKNMYTYEPFGEALEEQSGTGAPSNSFMFTGQFFDSEIDEYYLRARQYDPYIGRFASRDPLFGQFKEPMSLHVYLYCINDPINKIDPWGLLYTPAGGPDYNLEQTQHIIDFATEFVLEHGYAGMLLAFGPSPYDERYPWRGMFDYADMGFTFQIARCEGTGAGGFLADWEFGNYLAGYTTYYNYVEFGDIAVRTVGHMYARGDYLLGNSDIPWDDPGSKYFISAGILHARGIREQEGKRRGANIDFVMAKFGLYEGIRRAADTDLTSTQFDQELYNFLTFWHSSSK